MLRIDPLNPDHREALRLAIGRGIDLFDLGDFLSPGFASKWKFLAGSLVESGLPRARLLVRGDLGTAARFSEATHGIRVASLGTTALEWIYLVADPEFGGANYATLTGELDLLENQSRSGVIAAYGVGSAGFTFPTEDPEYLSLEPLLSASRPGFQWIEFPLNLYESEAATETNQFDGPNRVSLLAAARKWGLRTIARRPLDAMTENGLRRLVNYPDHHRLDLSAAVEQTLKLAIEIERETPGAHWAHRLHDQLKHMTDPEHWKEVVRRRIGPELAALRSGAGASDRYFDAMDALLLSVRLWCEKAAAERNERLRAALVQAVPSLAGERKTGDRDLARIALRIYRSIPELSYVLVGLRSPQYVHVADVAESLTSEEIQAAFETAHEALHERA